MMIRVTIALLALALLVTLTTCGGDPWIGRPAVDFAAEDLTGKRISLSDYRGKVVLLDFWATWCGPCLAELPNVKQVHDKYKDKGLVVIGISLDRDRSRLQSFVMQQGVHWPQIFEGGGGYNIAQLYRVNAIPSTFLLDREGVIRYTNLRGPRLERSVVRLLGNRNE